MHASKTAPFPAVPHPRQNGRTTLVIHGHLRGTRTLADLGRSRSHADPERPSKQRVAGSSPARRTQSFQGLPPR